jgi:hypothetical protein
VFKTTQTRLGHGSGDTKVRHPSSEAFCGRESIRSVQMNTSPITYRSARVQWIESIRFQTGCSRLFLAPVRGIEVLRFECRIPIAQHVQSTGHLRELQVRTADKLPVAVVSVAPLSTLGSCDEDDA